MPRLPYAAITFIGATALLAACDPAAFDPDLTPEERAQALIDSRGNRTCVRAVEIETGISGATPNTTLPVVELNQYIIDLPGDEAPWTCVTDDDGRAQYIYRTRVAG